MGCKKIIAVDISDQKLEDAKKCGATYVVNSSKVDPVNEIRDYTDSKCASLVLEMSGFPAAQAQAVLSAGKMGRVVLLGISHKNLELPAEAVDNIQRYQLSIIGS